MRFILPLLLAALLGTTINAAYAGDESAPPSGAPPSKLERVLNDPQREAVFSGVKSCWHEPAGTPAGQTVTLLLVVSSDDEVMDATVVPEDVARVDTPKLRGFALSALQAVTNPRCSRLSIPGGRISEPWFMRLRFVG